MRYSSFVVIIIIKKKKGINAKDSRDTVISKLKMDHNIGLQTQ